MVSQRYSDRSGELLEASKLLCFPRDTSLQGTPANNAIAERNNKDILEQTRTCLVRAGLPCAFWVFAAPAYCVMDNTETRKDGFSPLFHTHGVEFAGYRLPIGCAVIFYPAPTKGSGEPEK